MHEDLYSIERLFLLACKAEQKMKRLVSKTKESVPVSLSTASSMNTSSSDSSTMAATQGFVEVTPP
jgi:hypothetical protein